ncbi:MAG: winged helix-turn-helix transcriptional regulator [Rhizobiales bacterium]|nr:metalloregulator ArsR/SmtB family transcription factor [Hyphomicrobiales bacterium]NRB15750.1 winged helix-turn-helix transcriptional regulator [Hyphomicrobiales bacterium]
MKFEKFVDKTTEASEMLKLLANQKRLLILCKLAEAEETSVTELSKFVGLSQSALSQHLAKMRENKIIATRREAQNIYYRIDNKDVAKIMETLREIYC